MRLAVGADELVVDRQQLESGGASPWRRSPGPRLRVGRADHRGPARRPRPKTRRSRRATFSPSVAPVFTSVNPRSLRGLLGELPLQLEPRLLRLLHEEADLHGRGRAGGRGGLAAGTDQHGQAELAAPRGNVGATEFFRGEEDIMAVGRGWAETASADGPRRNSENLGRGDEARGGLGIATRAGTRHLPRSGRTFLFGPMAAPAELPCSNAATCAGVGSGGLVVAVGADRAAVWAPPPRRGLAVPARGAVPAGRGRGIFRAVCA
jgi:hypothetical protein